MCIYVYLCVSNVHACLYVFVCRCIYVFVYLGIYVFAYLCIYVSMYTCVHAYVYIEMCMCDCICLRAFVFVCIPFWQNREARSVAISRQQMQIQEFQKWWASGHGDAAMASHPLLSLVVS